jgi:hypothetical protein
MSVEEAIATTKMALRLLELRLFKGGAISMIDGAEFVRGPTLLLASRLSSSPMRPGHPRNRSIVVADGTKQA